MEVAQAGGPDNLDSAQQQVSSWEWNFDEADWNFGYRVFTVIVTEFGQLDSTDRKRGNDAV